MEYKEILNFLALCGLNCKKCFVNVEGEIRKTSEQLQKLLEGFDSYVEKFSKLLPILKEFHNFKEILDYFTIGECPDCRKGSCFYPNCGVSNCYQVKGVDFCFQCLEFPCENTNFDTGLRKRWLEMNKRMKEVGVEKYFEETKDLPRYK